MAHKLAKHAMIDKPVWPPAKGYTYLKDVAVGELVDTGSGLKAVVMEHTGCASLVLVLNADNHTAEDRQFYLGKHRWGNKTEVKVIGD
mgnify:CR=1 FL=1